MNYFRLNSTFTAWCLKLANHEKQKTRHNRNLEEGQGTGTALGKVNKELLEINIRDLKEREMHNKSLLRNIFLTKGN